MSINGQSKSLRFNILNFFSSITADFNISAALRWAIQDQLSSSFYLLIYGKAYHKILASSEKVKFRCWNLNQSIFIIKLFKWKRIRYFCGSVYTYFSVIQLIKDVGLTV